MNANTQKKVTAATFKSFVAKNREALQFCSNYAFDGMVDGSRPGSGKFKPAVAAINPNPKHDFGISGVWLVGRSRDYFEAFNKDGMTGIEVSNSCGCFVVAIPSA